ncbi:MAG: hypothetical protein Q8914_14165, partial [Bacteroidota bacterium]|nr:hypothetical protein [Bacteroidota bacterium]
MKTICISCLFLIIALALKAQERQVSLDNQGKVTSISAEMDRELKLFQDYPDFKEASVFQTGDSVFSLEIVCLQGIQLVKTKKTLTYADLQALRDSVSIRISRNAPELTLNQEGRTLMLVTNSLLGFYYGGALSNILDFKDDKLTVTTYLLTAGASFYLPYALTKDKNVTYGDAILGIYGQTRGIAHGLLVSDLIGFKWDSSLPMAMTLLGSLSEGIAGYLIADKGDFSAGRSAAIGTYSDFGMGIGMLTYGLLGLEKEKGFDAFALVGAASGLVIGHNLSKTTNYTWGDAFMLNGAGILGGYIPVSLMTLFPDAKEKAYFLVAELGTAGGLYAGDVLAQKFDFTTKEGIFIDLSESAGGLVGSG